MPRIELVPSNPTNMSLPKWIGIPQSNSPDESPPISENTLLDELVRLTRLPIEKETRPLGEPEAPILTAERSVSAGGQNHDELGKRQDGSRLVEGEGKNNPFDPVSMKLLYELPLKFVMNSPDWLVKYVVTADGVLLS